MEVSDAFMIEDEEPEFFTRMLPVASLHILEQLLPLGTKDCLICRLAIDWKTYDELERCSLAEHIHDVM